MCTALNVSRYVLKYCNDNNIYDCSNKKLQKLLYYIQAWSLALGKGPVFNDEIEAWVHGPAVRAVYRKYKEFSFNPIAYRPYSSDGNCLSADKREIADSVLKIYSQYDADFLGMRTHIEAPWLEARKSEKQIISLASIEDYYKGVLQNAMRNK